MAKDIDLKDVRRILEYTWSEASRCRNQALAALRRATLNHSAETRACFEQSVRDAIGRLGELAECVGACRNGCPQTPGKIAHKTGWIKSHRHLDATNKFAHGRVIPLYRKLMVYALPR